MKNTVLILIAILLVVAGVLSLITSGAEYAAEKVFYQAMKINQEITVNPDVAPPFMVAKVENKLKKVLERYPNTKTAKQAHLSLVEFYLGNKKYEQAISAAEGTLEKYGQDRSFASRVQFLKGVAYEQQDQWPQALKEYRVLRNQYTKTFLGLGIPLYIGEYYSTKGKDEFATAAYQEAVSFYTKLEKDNKGQAVGYAAINLLMRAYLILEQYEHAGVVLEKIISEYPKLRVFVQQIPSIEAIFIKKLNKPEKALQLYENIKVKTDNEKVIEFLDGRIEALTVQENQQ
ncbi:tetratricopeptide repeat protein [Candidatus Omnitrophota bacterium]